MPAATSLLAGDNVSACSAGGTAAARGSTSRHGNQPREQPVEPGARLRAGAGSSGADIGRVGKMPSRLTRLEPGTDQRAAGYRRAGDPGCFTSLAVRIRRPRSRKFSRDCRCARFGTETELLAIRRSTRRSSSAARGWSAKDKCSRTSRQRTRSKVAAP